MRMEAGLPSIDPNIDYTKILPIQQKRTIAFINHFVMNTVSFLNQFSQNCESKLMEFDDKIQKVEQALTVLESQLSSVNELDDLQHTPRQNDIDNSKAAIVLEETTTSIEETTSDVEDAIEETTMNGIKACEDPRFSKFFKMLQFGVPNQAVKIKMQTEGVNPEILDTPNDVIPGYELPITDNESNSSDTE